MPFRKRLKNWTATLRPPRIPSPDVSRATSTTSLVSSHNNSISAPNASSSNISDPVPLRLEGLWKEAYSNLQNKNPDLLAQYEGILLSSTKSDTLQNENRGNTDIDPRLESCVKGRLEAIENSRLKIRIGGREIEVRKQVRRVVGGILSVKDIISAAVSAEPHVSIAWAGVLFLLDPLAKSFHQDEDALDGFQAVSDLMVRYAFIEKGQGRIYSNSGCKPADSGQHLADLIRSKTVELYGLILEYHMSLATHLNHAGFKRFLHDWAEIDKWRNMLETITSLDQKIRQDLTAFAGDDIQRIFKELENSQRVVMDSLAVLKQEFHEAKQRELLNGLPLVLEARFGSFDDGNNPECLEGTRTEILREIQTWAENPDDSPVFWLRGMAGTGKSTISRTFAAACQQRKSLVPHGSPLAPHVYLGATFFFDRTKPGRNTVEKLFPTISNELASSFPDARDKVCRAISENQFIGTQNLRNQWNKLILEPLLTLEKELLLPVTLVLLLDALDEAMSEDHNEAGKPAHDIGGVLRLMATSGKLQHIRLKFFFTSRPEIFSQFRHVLSREVNIRNFELPKTSVMSQMANIPKDDITIYLEHRIRQVVSQATVDYPESPVKPTCWLSQDEERGIVRTLAEKSDGLFIYAATACRFLEGVDCDLDDLQTRMRELSDVGTEGVSPQDNLDRTYSQILKYSVIYNSRKTKAEKHDFYELFERVIGAVVVLAEPLSIATLEDLLDLAEKAPKTRRLLNSLSSVVSCGVGFGSPIQLLHLSFRDFLLGQPKRRCLYDEFCIDTKRAHADLFRSCLKLLSRTLKQDICSLDSPSFLTEDIDPSLLNQRIPASVRYASQYWSHHLQQAGIELFDDDCVHQFLKQNFLYWLEVMSLLRMIPTAIHNIIKLESYLADLPRDGRSELQDMLYDMKRFILASKNEAEKAPAQVYRSALIFAPENSICRSVFRNLIPRSFSRLPKTKKEWDPLLQEFEYGEYGEHLAISSDGKTLAVLNGSLMADRIKLWDLTTGTLLDTIDCGGHAESIAFLTGDKYLVCYGGLRSVRIWDIEYGALLRTVLLTDDGDTLASSLMNPNCTSSLSLRGYLAVVYPNGTTIGLICTTQGVLQKIYVPSTVNAIAWSSDGFTLAISVIDGSILFWDASESAFMPSLMEPFGFGRVLKLAFSPDGALLTERLLDDSVLIQLWEWEAGTLVWQIVDDSQEWRECRSVDFAKVAIIAFYPTEKVLATWNQPAGLQRWDYVSRKRLMRIPTPKNETSVKLSPNGKLFVVATEAADGTPITELFDTSTGVLLTRLKGIQHRPNFIFTPEGRILISIDREQILRVWDLSSNLEPEKLANQQTSIDKLTLSPDHRFVLSKSTGHIGLWGINAGSPLRVVSRGDTWGIADIIEQALNSDYKRPILTKLKMPLDGNTPNDIFDELVEDLVHVLFNSQPATDLLASFIQNREKAISPNGRLLAKTSSSRKEISSGDDDISPEKDEVTVWDVSTGEVVRTLHQGNHRYLDLSFSPDARLLAIGYTRFNSGINTLEIWDIESGKVRVQEKMTVDDTLQQGKVLWSADGTKVALNSVHSGGALRYDATLFLYDLVKKASVTLKYPGLSAALSPDGRRVATKAFDKSLSWWEIVGDNLTLLGQRADMHWGSGRSRDDKDNFRFEGDQVIATDKTRTDVRSLLPNWDSRTSRQILLEDGWIMYGPERVLLPLQYRPRGVLVTKDNVLVIGHASGEITFWEFADEEIQS
ncbi:hypothetical protein AbraIFM66951_007862 [Aspergillus brasiliensis]|uniref:NWD NACHT-NTPase N-terminal domain-containing protein n=1 Tax=Aspergillus brasiliensis TaxID=319629 RepID=A0A9W5Z0Y2_9EURO|nr:hypothetical protein AbraCBS73388_002523 [Aspergillus brasiliensis]GKZ45260.1 hypothetical protein AbraIFM66951_007862 [Aspergillus brasiliensis]